MTTGRCSTLGLLLVAAACAACSPVLDWRESRPEGSGAKLMFPCRPSSIERPVVIAGDTLPMRQHACAAGGANFSLAVADAASPERVQPVLAAWRAQAVGNVAGTAAPLPEVVVAGATPTASSGCVRIDGRLPDGRPVVEQTCFFVKGTRLYQAAVVGTGRPVGAEALDNFFSAIRLQ